MNEEDYIGKKCDYYHQFVKNAVSDLKANGICYVYYLDQIEEIRKKIKVEITIVKNESGYTLSIPRKYRKEM